MVPADAEMIIEGEIPANVREVEGPFGEFPGTYGPQRLRWIIDVKAMTHRKNAIYQDIFVGHADDWVMGAIPKEGALYNRIKGVVPGVKAVHLPNSGVGRFNCYISIDKRVRAEGFSNSAATPLPASSAGTSPGLAFHSTARSSSAASAPGPRSSTSRNDRLMLAHSLSRTRRPRWRRLR